MELREVRSFVVVAEHGTFSHAAVTLGMAQPSLTQQIQKLERELDVQLFRRTRPALQLTEAGEAFLTEARALLAQAHVAADTARSAARGEIGKLSIGHYDSAQFVIVPAVLRGFLGRYPNVRLQFAELTSSRQLAALSRGEIDVGFLRGPVADPRFASRCVAMEPLLVAVPASHALATQPTVPIAALQSERFVLQPRARGTALHDEIISLCHHHGFSPLVVQEAAETYTVCALVAAGVGVSLVPASMRVLQTDGVVYRPISPARPIMRCVAWLTPPRLPALRAFVETLPRDHIAF